MFIIPSEEGKFSEGITKATTERGVIVGSYHGKEIKLNMILGVSLLKCGQIKHVSHFWWSFNKESRLSIKKKIVHLVGVSWQTGDGTRFVYPRRWAAGLHMKIFTHGLQIFLCNSLMFDIEFYVFCIDSVKK